MFPRPLGPEELPKALGQALCPSGPPLHSRPPRPRHPLSLGGGAPEAVEKGGLIGGGSCGVPGAGKGPLGPGESPEAPGQASCPSGPPLPPGPPLPSRPSPAPSGGPSTLWGPLHPLLCSSVQNPVLWDHLHSSWGPFCPLDWALQPPGHPLPSCVLRGRRWGRPSRADRGGSLWVWRSRETFWSQGASGGPWHDPLHPEARSAAEAPLGGWSPGHPLLRPKAFSGDMCLESIAHPCLNRNLPHTQTPPKPCPSQSVLVSAVFVVGCFGLLGGWEGILCFVCQ